MPPQNLLKPTLLNEALHSWKTCPASSFQQPGCAALQDYSTHSTCLLSELEKLTNRIEIQLLDPYSTHVA